MFPFEFSENHEIYDTDRCETYAEYLLYGGGPAGGIRVYQDGTIKSWHQDWFKPIMELEHKHINVQEVDGCLVFSRE